LPAGKGTAVVVTEKDLEKLAFDFDIEKEGMVIDMDNIGVGQLAGLDDLLSSASLSSTLFPDARHAPADGTGHLNPQDCDGESNASGQGSNRSLLGLLDDEADFVGVLSTSVSSSSSASPSCTLQTRTSKRQLRVSLPRSRVDEGRDPLSPSSYHDEKEVCIQAGRSLFLRTGLFLTGNSLLAGDFSYWKFPSGADFSY
jgi:hypothetical protein